MSLEDFNVNDDTNDVCVNNDDDTKNFLNMFSLDVFGCMQRSHLQCRINIATCIAA